MNAGRGAKPLRVAKGRAGRVWPRVEARGPGPAVAQCRTDSQPANYQELL